MYRNTYLHKSELYINVNRFVRRLGKHIKTLDMPCRYAKLDWTRIKIHLSKKWDEMHSKTDQYSNIELHPFG